MEIKVLVSIIIPVYNMCSFVSEALESVIHQTYENLEIIIIDDGSTDGSDEICDKYAKEDKRIRLIHQKNKGLSCARNVGLDLMSGDMVVFLDADDAYRPDYIKEMLLAIIRDRSDLVICKYTVFHTIGKMIPEGRGQANPSIEQGLYDRVTSLQALAEGTINPMVWNKLYRRELWSDIRFPEGHVHEDIATAYQVFNKCDVITVLKQPLYYRRKHDGTITNTISRNNVADWILAMTYFESFVQNNVPAIFSDEQLKKIRRARLYQTINYYARLSCEKKKDNKFINDLRDQIIELGREVGIGDCGFRRKACYQMICLCPLLMLVACKFYYPLQRMLIYGRRRYDIVKAKEICFHQQRNLS